MKGYLTYDTTIFLAGTALGFVDYKMKNIVDRLLPLATMYTCFVDGEMRHAPDMTSDINLAFSIRAKQTKLT